LYLKNSCHAAKASSGGYKCASLELGCSQLEIEMQQTTHQTNGTPRTQLERQWWQILCPEEQTIVKEWLASPDVTLDLNTSASGTDDEQQTPSNVIPQHYSLQAMQNAKSAIKAKPQQRTLWTELKQKPPQFYALGPPKPAALQARRHHVNICLQQRNYKQYLQKLETSGKAQMKPMSLYHKRKRVCAEYISKCEATQGHGVGTHVTEVGRGASTMIPLGVREMELDARPPLKTCKKMWELVKDLESITDVNYNFIWRDMSAGYSTKRMRTRTKHFKY